MTVNYASTTNQINEYRLKKKQFEVLIIPVAIASLLYITLSQAKGTFLLLLLLTVSKMGEFHAEVLNFEG